MMAKAYREMLERASTSEVKLQTLKLLRARFQQIKRTRGRGEFTQSDVDDATDLINRTVAKVRKG